MRSKVFCFSYAGGSADFYSSLRDSLVKEELELVAVEYAGHGTRRKERAYDNFAQLAEDMSEQIIKNIVNNENYYLMGYSMGTIAVIEVLKHLMALDFRMPKGVILAAHEPKAKSELTDWNKNFTDEIIKERILRFGGVPDNLTKNDVYWRVYLPVYRNDFRLIGEYDFKHMNLTTEIPALILYSEADTPFCEIKNWNKYFTGKNKYQNYDGNHFFINDHILEIADLMFEWIEEDCE